MNIFIYKTVPTTYMFQRNLVYAIIMQYVCKKSMWLRVILHIVFLQKNRCQLEVNKEI